MKKTRFQQMQAQMQKQFGPEQGERIVRAMGQEYEQLCQAYANQPQAMFSHTHNNIFPVVTAFHALLAEGLDRPRAAEAASAAFLELMQAPARAIQTAMKFPGLYHLMPWLWKTLLPKLFSEDAGFVFRFYPVDRTQVKFDILACPYRQVCLDLDCPELAPTFCTTDDICYGHMHPKLLWNRTKTIARGGDCCDFDLSVSK